jgi:hypothetical protein
MALRGWKQGWPVLQWAEPIERVLDREKLAAQEKARAEEVERARLAARVRDDARDDALKTHEQEGQMVKAARVNVLVLLNATGRLGPALQVLSEQIRQRIETNQLDPSEASGLLRNVASAAGQMVKAGQVALQLERLYRGQPTDILGITPTEMSQEEALAELAAGQEEMKRFNRRGLAVIEGGQSEEVAS